MTSGRRDRSAQWRSEGCSKSVTLGEPNPDRYAVRTFRFTPDRAGLARRRCSEISGGSATENAAHITDILNGATGARSDAVLLNAGFVAVLAGRAADVEEGVRLARETIKAGKARELLAAMRKVSHELASERKGAA